MEKTMTEKEAWGNVLREQRKTRWQIPVVGLLLVALVLGTGCATALGVGVDYTAERMVESARRYCQLPPPARSLLRKWINEQLEGTSTLVNECVDDEGYEDLRRVYVDPHLATTIDSIIAEVLDKGFYTLPNGSTIRMVVDSPEGE